MVTDQSIEKRLGRLRIWNIVVGLILAVQAVVIAVLTNNFDSIISKYEVELSVKRHGH